MKYAIIQQLYRFLLAFVFCGFFLSAWAQQHQVQAGETLYTVATKYGVTIEQLLQQNKHISVNYFPAGVRLTIPASELLKKGIANSDCREMHKVKKGETLYGICRQYNLKEEQLRAANPSIQDEHFSLKTGMFLCIPFIATPTATQSPSSAPLALQRKHLTATVFLPFKSTEEEGKRCVEFCRGLIAAAEALTQESMNITLHLINENAANSDIEEPLLQISQQRPDLIIGTVYPTHFAKMAAFSKEKNIPLIIPFSSKVKEVQTHPSLFLVNAPESQKATYATRLFQRFFKAPHTLFVTTSDGILPAFSGSLKEQLTAQQLSHATLAFRSLSFDWKSQLKPNAHNLFFVSTNNIAELQTIITKIKHLQVSAPSYSISLVLDNDIFPLMQEVEEELFTIDTYLLTPYFFNTYSSKAKVFANHYQSKYQEAFLPLFPSMAALGYDVAYQVLKQFSYYDKSYRTQVVKTQPYQHLLRFVPIHRDGGYINSNMLLLHYKKNRTIDQISL